MKNLLLPATISLLVLLFFADVGPRLEAQRRLATATSVQDLVEDFAEQLDSIAKGYGFDADERPAFTDEGFNQRMRMARGRLEQARESVDNGTACDVSTHFYRSVRSLDNATNFAMEANTSNYRFSDTLAKLSKSKTRAFLENLLLLAQPGESTSTANDVSPDDVAIATQLKQRGDNLTTGEAGNWAPATRRYKRAICHLVDALTL